MVKFYVIDGASLYNAILGWPNLANLRAITSITHMKMKFLTPYGIGEVCADQEVSRVCYSTALNLAQTTSKKKKDNGKGIMTIFQEVE